MAETTEAEMVTRLADSARQSADYVAQMCRAIASGRPIQPRILVALRRALRQASGSAGQLGHAQQNPAFFGLRDTLESVAKTLFSASVIHSPRQGLVLARIGSLLEDIRDQAVRMAAAKPVPRQNVLGMLDRRVAGMAVN